MDCKHEFYEDPTGGRGECLVFAQRVDLLGYLGVTPFKIGDFCHRLGYGQCVTDIIVSSDELDLWENCNDSWIAMRRKVEKFSEARRRGRDCYHTAKDICIDALFTDLVKHFMGRLYPDFDFRKNSQDEAFDLLPSVSLEPDFRVNGAWLEMKVAKTETDDCGRSNWTDSTFTLRAGQAKSQLLDYGRYRPLYFLRINYEEKIFAVISHSDFRPSYSRDGSYFARIRAVKIPPGMARFVQSLHDELERSIPR